MRRDRDTVDAVEDGPCGTDVVLQSRQDRRRRAQDIDPFRCADGEEGGHGCRKDKGRAVDALQVMYDKRRWGGEIRGSVPDGRPHFVSRHRIRQMNRDRSRQSQ